MLRLHLNAWSYKNQPKLTISVTQRSKSVIMKPFSFTSKIFFSPHKLKSELLKHYCENASTSLKK